MANITITVTEEKIDKMKFFYQEFMQEVNNPYIVFSAKVDGCVINLYTSNKCTFQGDNALDEVLIWQDIEETNQKTWEIIESHIGSDEVGTGDFFGPVIVCACYIEETDIDFINGLGVADSKKLSDEKIKEIAPKLVKKLTYSCLVCDNETYNTQINKGLNMNSIKAILHNRAFLNVIKKRNLNNPKIVIDQFADPKNYYNYLKNTKDPVVNNIIFQTKGETYSPAVACASIIARFRFLEKMDEYSKYYKLGDIPKGASQLVDIFGQLFIKTYGINELKKVAKLNFKNLEKINNPLKKDIE